MIYLNSYCIFTKIQIISSVVGLYFDFLVGSAGYKTLINPDKTDNTGLVAQDNQLILLHQWYWVTMELDLPPVLVPFFKLGTGV